MIRCAAIAACAMLALATSANAHPRTPMARMSFTRWIAAPTYPAPNLVTPDGTAVGGQYQLWASQARVPLYQGAITMVSMEPLCGVPMPAGCSYWSDGSQPSIAENPGAGIQTLYHELGHIFDAYFLTPADRTRLLGLMGFSGRTWDEGWDPNGGAQDAFADSYVECARHYGTPGWPRNAVGWIAPEPTWQDLRAVCRLIASKAGQQQPTPNLSA